MVAASISDSDRITTIFSITPPITTRGVSEGQRRECTYPLPGISHSSGGTSLRHEGRAVRPWMDAWLPTLSLAYATGCDFRASPQNPKHLIFAPTRQARFGFSRIFLSSVLSVPLCFKNRNFLVLWTLRLFYQSPFEFWENFRNCNPLNPSPSIYTRFDIFSNLLVVDLPKLGDKGFLKRLR